MVLIGELFAGHIALDAGDAMDELQIATLTATLLHLASVGYRQPEKLPFGRAYHVLMANTRWIRPHLVGL